MFNLAYSLAKAKYLPDLAPDVAYIVQAGLFYGSLRKAEPNDMRDKTVALYNPSFTQKQHVLGLAVEKHEKELLRYYTDVLRAMQQHRKELNALSSYFWMRPVVRSRGKTLMSFPWHDTYPETAGFLRAVQDPSEEATLYSDLDQGWQVELYAAGNKLYLAQGSDDDDEPGTVYYTDRDRFAKLAAEALARTQYQLALFVRETGQNPWKYA